MFQWLSKFANHTDDLGSALGNHIRWHTAPVSLVPGNLTLFCLFKTNAHGINKNKF